jgi:sigma-B regulation protein RsbU (phosphoserine phosphatase)
LDAILEMQRALSSAGSPVVAKHIFARWAGHYLRFDAFVNITSREAPPDQYRIIEQASITLDNLRDDDAHQDWQHLPLTSGGMFNRALGVTTPTLHTNLSLADDPHADRCVKNARSCLIIPIFSQGDANEWILLFRNAPDEPTELEIETAALSINLLSRAVVAQRLGAELAETATSLQARIDELAQTQRSILPESLPEIPGWELAVEYHPSDAAGGDYYDFRRLDQPCGYGFIIADVSGHGPAAAVGMAVVRAAVSIWSIYKRPSELIIAEMNRLIRATLPPDQFVTACFVAMDERTGACLMGTCGHPPAIIRRADGSVEILDKVATMPLGIVDELEPLGDAFTLEPGDALILYTDGITESRSNPPQPVLTAHGAYATRPGPSGAPAPRLMLGTSGLVDVIRHAPTRSEDLVRGIVDAAQAHRGVPGREDDQTVLCIRRLPA